MGLAKIVSLPYTLMTVKAEDTIGNCLDISSPGNDH